jgi:hypothetical protein
MLIKKQYEVLSLQEEKFKVEIEKIKLENIKLQRRLLPHLTYIKNTGYM